MNISNKLKIFVKIYVARKNNDILRFKVEENTSIKGGTMIEDKVKLENGYLVSVKNITEVEDVWTFDNCDPFIHMRFDTPITALRIEIVLKNSLNKEIHTAVYYKNKKDSFSEEKCCCYNVYLNLFSMDDISFYNHVDVI